MASFKLLLLITLWLVMCPTNWALSMTSSDSLLVSSKSPLSSSNTKEPGPVSSSSSVVAAATLGDLYRKSRQSRCVRCYDDRYGDDYERSRYNPGSGGPGGIRGAIPGGGGGYSSYPSRTYDERPGNWYYPRETNDRYDESRVGYGSYSGGGGGGGGGGSGSGRENDRYYYPYNGYYFERSEDRYNTRTYDRYERDRYDSRYSHERSPSETRGYGHGYESRDRYYPSDRSNDYYRGGDRYSDRNRGSSSGSYDRYGQDDRYLSRYDYRNYRPWDETYRGQSGFDNSGRGYYFANERPNDYYEPPPPPPPPYGSQYRPSLGPSSGPGPSTPGPTYVPRDPHHEQSRPSNSHHGYPDDRPGSSSSPSSSSSSSSSGSSASGPEYSNRPRDDVHGSGGGGGGGNGGSGGGSSGGGGDNKNGYTSGSWSYVNDREKDASYKGGIRDKDNQSSPYGGGRGRPSLSGSYLLDRDNNNIPETSMAINPDKPSGDSHQIIDSPIASKLTSPPASSSSSSSTSKLTTEDRVTESKDSN